MKPDIETMREIAKRYMAKSPCLREAFKELEGRAMKHGYTIFGSDGNIVLRQPKAAGMPGHVENYLALGSPGSIYNLPPTQALFSGKRLIAFKIGQ